MAVLEYYAFESAAKNATALKSYRTLARHSLRTFIYRSLGYVDGGESLGWLDYRTRLVNNPAPKGYFNIVTEMARLVLVAIQAGLSTNWRTVPDISIGRTWSTYWTANNLEAEFGERVRYDHNYPEHYPQAEANPHPSYAYPIASLGRFQSWLQEVYAVKHFPKYLLDKAKKGAISDAAALALIEVIRRDLAITSEE